MHLYSAYKEFMTEAGMFNLRPFTTFMAVSSTIIRSYVNGTAPSALAMHGNNTLSARVMLAQLNLSMDEVSTCTIRSENAKHGT
jgi:hypothetical protein